MNKPKSFEEFYSMYERLDRANRFRVDLRFCQLLAGDALRRPSRATIRAAVAMAWLLAWPWIWRGLAWLAFATLAGLTVVRLAG